MDDDNLIPNPTHYFLPSEDQALASERQQEKGEVRDALPVIKDIIERFNDRIAFYSSVDSIPETQQIDPAQFMIAHKTNQAMTGVLRAEKEYLESLLEDAQ